MKLGMLLEKLRTGQIEGEDELIVESRDKRYYFSFITNVNGDIINIREKIGKDLLLEKFGLVSLLSFDYKVIQHRKLDRLELRRVDKYLTMGIGKFDTLEIVEWDSKYEYCYTLAYWENNNDGYELKLVGDRFLQTNQEELMKLINEGQIILNKKYREEEQND